MRTNRSFAIVAAVIAFALTGCAAGGQMGGDNRELRRMVVETRHELEEVRRDQERLRALVEYMQYAGGTAPQGSAYPTVAERREDPRWNTDSSWSYQRDGETFAASADDIDPSAAPRDRESLR